MAQGDELQGTLAKSSAAASHVHSFTNPQPGSLLLLAGAIRGDTVTNPEIAEAGWIEAEQRNDGQIWVYEAYKIADGTEDGITLSGFANGNVVTSFREIEGPFHAAPFDKEASGQIGGTDAATVATGATAALVQARNVVHSSLALRIGSVASSGFTPGSVGTVRSDTANNSAALADGFKVIDTTAAQSETWSWTTAQRNGIAYLSVFRLAGPAIASYVADPSPMANGATSSLAVSATPATPGNTLEYLHEVTGGPGTIGNPAANPATLNGAGGASQVTHTVRVTVTEKDGGGNVVGTSTATVAVVEQAPTSQKPTITSGTATPPTATEGQQVQLLFEVTDPDGIVANGSWLLTPGPGVTLSSTTIPNPTVDTTAMAEGTYSVEAVFTDEGGTPSDPFMVLFDVVAAGAPVGPWVLPKVSTVETSTGIHDAVLEIVIEGMTAGEAYYLDTLDHSLGITDEPGPGGTRESAETEFQIRRPAQMDRDGTVAEWGDPEAVRGGAVPASLAGVANHVFYEAAPGTPIQMRSRVRAVVDGLLVTSPWSEWQELVPEITSAWLKVPEAPNLNMPVTLTQWLAAEQTREEQVVKPLGAERVQYVGEWSKPTGAMVIITDTEYDRRRLDEALKWRGAKLIQRPPDPGQPGRNTYFLVTGPLSEELRAQIPLELRDHAVGYLEVDAP